MKINKNLKFRDPPTLPLPFHTQPHHDNKSKSIVFLRLLIKKIKDVGDGDPPATAHSSPRCDCLKNKWKNDE